MATNTDITKRLEQHIWNTQLDTAVEPARVVVGVAGKNPSGGYTPLNVDASGNLNNALPAVTNTTSTLTLTSAATAYKPTAPSSAYLLVMSNNSDTDMKWGFATATATGVFLAKSGGVVAMVMAADQAPFVNCASAGKVLDYSTTVL